MRCSGPRELLRMNARRKALTESEFQDVSCLLSRKGTAIAENIAELSQFLTRHFRNETLQDLEDVIFCSVFPPAEVRGHHVRAEERGNNFERLFRIQFF